MRVRVRRRGGFAWRVLGGQRHQHGSDARQRFHGTLDRRLDRLHRLRFSGVDANGHEDFAIALSDAIDGRSQRRAAVGAADAGYGGADFGFGRHRILVGKADYCAI